MTENAQIEKELMLGLYGDVPFILKAFLLKKFPAIFLISFFLPYIDTCHVFCARTAITLIFLISTEDLCLRYKIILQQVHYL